jgi:hypothetical protein
MLMDFLISMKRRNHRENKEKEKRKTGVKLANKEQSAAEIKLSRSEGMIESKEKEETSTRKNRQRMSVRPNFADRTSN